MKARLNITILLLICVTSGHAQNGLELFGYFESQAMGAVIEERLNQVFMNKLRVDFN